MTKETGGPAFPRPASEAHQHGMHSPQEGMTLRDYFAAKAMQASLVETMKATNGDAKKLARNSYVIADWMLEAREEK